MDNIDSVIAGGDVKQISRKNQLMDMIEVKLTHLTMPRFMLKDIKYSK